MGYITCQHMLGLASNRNGNIALSVKHFSHGKIVRLYRCFLFNSD